MSNGLEPSTGTVARARRCCYSTDSPALATTGGTYSALRLVGPTTIARPARAWPFNDVRRVSLRRRRPRRISLVVSPRDRSRQGDWHECRANTLLHMATQRRVQLQRDDSCERAISMAMSRSAPCGAMRATSPTTAEDMNFTPTTLSSITARTSIVHGDRDPLYPVEPAVELLRAIAQCSVPDIGC